MKKYYFLIIVALILSLVLTGCSLLSNISQVPATDQSGITYLTKNGLLPDLVGLWRFNDNALDSSGNNNHGTVYGATYVDGMFGKALSFDGIDDYVEVTDPGTGSSLDVDGITIEAWIYFDTDRTGHNNIVRKGPYADRTYGLDIGVPGTNRIRGWVNRGSTGGATAVIAEGATTLALNTWYHVAMTYDGTYVRVYVNRTQDGISGSTSGNIFDNNQSLRIGGQPLASEGRLPFKGLIDEVRIWNGALSEGQLGRVYDFDGFFPPVDNVELNVAKAGRAIPVKFSLSGYQGLKIFEVGYPRSVVIDCESPDPGAIAIEGTDTAGGSSLSYDADADQYIYVWKTEKAWVDTCRQLVVKLIDGTYHRANFTFK